MQMLGGEDEIVNHFDPIFRSLAPGRGDIPRTPGRDKADGTAEQGYLHCGPNGAGHFVKMVHNGIEYGVMAAYAEGFAVLKAANIGKKPGAIDAETTPLRDPEHYRYDLNLPDIAEVWRRGSVIASWLLDLSATALLQDPTLKNLAGRVSDSGFKAAKRCESSLSLPRRTNQAPARSVSPRTGRLSWGSLRRNDP